jgi:hypothetical protein
MLPATGRKLCQRRRENRLTHGSTGHFAALVPQIVDSLPHIKLPVLPKTWINAGFGR